MNESTEFIDGFSSSEARERLREWVAIGLPRRACEGQHNQSSWPSAAGSVLPVFRPASGIGDPLARANLV